jgi:hypothetical protein
MVFQLASAWNTEFGLFIFLQRGILGGGVEGTFPKELGISCVVMICPGQTAMFLRAFFPKVNALLSRLKDLAAPGIRMVVHIARVVGSKTK